MKVFPETCGGRIRCLHVCLVNFFVEAWNELTFTKNGRETDNNKENRKEEKMRIYEWNQRHDIRTIMRERKKKLTGEWQGDTESKEIKARTSKRKPPAFNKESQKGYFFHRRSVDAMGQTALRQ